MNDDFKKWLLVSDIDGTLNDKFQNLPENNRLKIRDFVAKGGNFTLCSGRNLQSLSIHYNKLGVETPAVFLNGAGIYDFKTKNVLYYQPISAEGEEILLDIKNRFKSLQMTVFSPEKIHLYKKSCIYGLVISKMDKLSFEYCLKEKDLPFGNWGKITFFGMPKLIKNVEKIIKNEINSRIFNCFFTSPYTLEIVAKGVNKGTAVSKLGEILGIKEENIAAIGDYYNDFDMLKTVCHPVCCSQAPDDIKAICEYVAVHCNEGAVADFIEYIEKNYIQG